MSHACHRFWKCYKTLTFCSLMTRCTIPCAGQCASCHNGVHFLSTSQLPKVLCTWCALYILTSKRASGHNGIHCFDISTSKSGPELLWFLHFDLEVCFAPQRRALFRHLNFQKWPENGVLRTFWLPNVLCATTACTFSTSQLPKIARTWGFVQLDFQMCFAPQRRAFFRHLNFQKCSECEVLF